MNRKEELLKAVGDDPLLIPSITEMVYLEEQLDYLRSLPKIKVHPTDPTKQKVLPAAKQYKDLLQQYNNILKTLLRATGTDADDEESPLRKWMNGHLDSE